MEKNKFYNKYDAAQQKGGLCGYGLAYMCVDETFKTKRTRTFDPFRLLNLNAVINFDK